MPRVVLSRPLRRDDDAELVIVEFRLRATPAMAAAIADGDVPQFLPRPSGSPFGCPLWAVGPAGPFAGGWSLRPGEVNVPDPTDAYRLTAAQRRELEPWLDRVAPGWENASDPYGNPRVTIVDAVPQGRVDRTDAELDRAWCDGPGRLAGDRP